MAVHCSFAFKVSLKIFSLNFDVRGHHVAMRNQIFNSRSSARAGDLVTFHDLVIANIKIQRRNFQKWWDEEQLTSVRDLEKN